MALYEICTTDLLLIPETTFRDEGITERFRLQPLIEQRLEVVAPDCLLLTTEFDEWTTSQRRIDLLALGRDGAPVVIELKRTDDDPYVELQALTYAALASSMTFGDAVSIHAKYLARRGIGADARERILEFLGWEIPREDEFAQDVRIIIAAQDFAPDVTSTVLWLRDRGIDITCVRLTPYRLESRILLKADPIIPVPEASQYQESIRIKQREEREHRRAVRGRGRFSLDLNGKFLDGLSANRLALEVITWALTDRGASPAKVEEDVGFNRGDLWLQLPVGISEEVAVEELSRRRAETGKQSAYKTTRWFYKESELIRLSDRTLMLSTQWEVDVAKRTAEMLLEHYGSGVEVYGLDATLG